MGNNNPEIIKDIDTILKKFKQVKPAEVKKYLSQFKNV
jgi:hypothetical protein